MMAKTKYIQRARITLVLIWHPTRPVAVLADGHLDIGANQAVLGERRLPDDRHLAATATARADHAWDRVNTTS